MKRYIEQLIGDIHQATWRVRPPREIWDHADPDYDVEREDMAFVEKFMYGENHIEFCHYEEKNCPFPGYCNTCNEITEQMKFDEEQANRSTSLTDDDELPF